MKRTHKVQFTALFYIPIFFSTLIIASYQFTQQTLFATKLSYIFALLCLFTLFSPLGKWKIGNNKNQSTCSGFKWIIAIIFAEIGLLALFLVQCHVSVQALIETGQIYPHGDVTPEQLLPTFLINLGLFPWTLFATVSAYFAYSSYTNNPHLTFSAPLFKSLHHFIANIIRRIIDINIQMVSVSFIILTTIFLAIQSCLLIYPSVHLFTPLRSLFIGCTCSIVFFLPITQQLLNRIQRSNRQGWHFMVMFMTATLVILSIGFMGNQLATVSVIWNQHVTLPFSVLKDPQSTFHLSLWCWWIFSTPLICSYFVHCARGKTVRALMLAILAPPCFLLGTFFGLHALFIQTLNLLLSSQWIGIPLLIGFATFVYFILNPRLDSTLWLGFIPVTPLTKEHQIPAEKLWMLFISLLSILLLLNISGIVMSCILGAPTCLIIFLSLYWSQFKSPFPVMPDKD